MSDCRCLACQSGFAVACAATERRIRRDERAFLASQITAGVNAGELLELRAALTKVAGAGVARRAMSLVHVLTVTLESRSEAA